MELRRQQRQAAGGTTYHDHAMADAELSVGGRFAAYRPQVNGADSIVRTPVVAPHWSRELASLPDEPSLGYAIDDVGEALGGAGGGSDG
jgi:hypothetical protein